jgi:undecaprenyl-phosphate 4-deoxy-4-formamido-L-arabinose transferase
VHVSVVIPCYRSAKTLPDLTARLNAVLPTATESYEVVLVVDGSPDDTWDVARGLAVLHEHVRAMRLARNYGQSNALIAGIRAAKHEVIVTMDDDLQHPPEEVPKLLAALTDDLDLVYGIAEAEEHGVGRSLASRIVKRGLSGVVGVANANVLSAFRAFRSFLVGGFEQVSGPHVSVDVALSWATTRIGATTVHMDERTVGRSNYTFSSLFKHALNLIMGYSIKPLRLVTLFGGAVGLAGFALFARVLWLYFAHQTTVAGFTTVAAMVAIFSAAQMIAIGVLGEYIGRIHAHGMGRPTYVIRESVGGASRASAGRPAVSPANGLTDPGDLQALIR